MSEYGVAVPAVLSMISRCSAPSQGCIYPGVVVPWLRLAGTVKMEV